MYFSKKAFYRLNNIPERSLRLPHHDYVTKFFTHPVNAAERAIHQKCLEFLVIEGYNT